MKRSLFVLAALAAFAAQAGDSVGVKECDEYITKYSACVNTKITGDAQKQFQNSMKMTADAWKQAATTEQGKAGLATGCKAALDAAKQSMAAYGCSW